MKFNIWRATLPALLLCLFAPFAYAQDVIWRDIVQGATGEATTARHVQLLTNGDAIVGGSVGPTATRDFLVYRINGANGNIVWTRRFDGGGTSETVTDLAIDPANGDTWFCGTSSLTGQGLNWKVMKLNGADGTNGWAGGVYTYNGPSSSNDAPRMCKLIQDGAAKNLIVVGQASTSFGNGARVIKINAATGAQVWEFNNFAVFQEYVNLVVNDATGDIYATGSSTGNGFQTVAMVTRLNLAGAAQWTVFANARAGETIVNITNGQIEAATGDLIGSGFTNVNNDNDIWITRFAKTNGAKTWQTLINGPGNGIDGGQAIEVDATYAYIGTGQYSTVGGGTDLFFARLNLTNGLYDAANGGWTQSFGGDDSASQENLSNLKLSNGTLYAAGSTRYLTPGRVLTTAKLNPATGAIINRTNFTDRIGPQLVGFKSMQVESNGDMIIAGDSGVATSVNFAEIGRFGGASTANDANLSNLTISVGTLAPVFNSSVQAYSANVGNGTTSMTVTPTVAQTGATVRVNGTLVTSGSPSGAISLAVGLTDISVVVTATDGTSTKTYNLTVERAVCPTCPPPWTSIEAFGNTSTPNASMARSATDIVYGMRIKDGGANATMRLLRYDNPGPTGTWTTVGEFARTTVTPAIDSLDGDPSLAIDRTGRFHVVFTGRTATTDGVYYATSATGANGTWAFTQIATISGTNTDMQDAVVKTDPTNNLPRVVYVSSDATGARAYNLYVATFSGTAWSSTLLLNQTGSNEIRVPDIDIDSTGKIHIAFAAETNGAGTDGSLMYVNNVSGSFPAPTNLVAGATGNDQARSLSLMLDTSDRVHIVRQNQTNQLVETTNVTGSFVSTQLNGSVTGSVRPDSLSRNDFNDIYLAYRNTSIEMRYAYLPGGTGTTWLTGLLYRGNSNTAVRHAGVVTNTRFGFAMFDHRPTGPSGNQELWAAIQLLPAPEIVVEQPAATDIVDGGAKAYGNVAVGASAPLTFTIRNIGAAPLNLGAITKDGTNAADFTVTTSPTSPVAVGGSTTFVLTFVPGAVGARSAAIHIANNDANENPFDISVSGTGTNTAPVITPASALTRQRGSSSTAATVATVSDAETAAGSLVVTAPTVPAGIGVASLTNAAGTVSAVVTASCTATLGANTVVLRVADVASATTDGNLTVNVTANTAPTLTYANQSALPGGTLTVNPATGLTDNGTIASVVVQSQGSYTGTISVNASGVVSLSAIAPSGTHTITIRATDNCGSTTDATFNVAVNASPTVTPATGLTRQRGTAASVATLGSVADAETAAGSIGVSVTPPAGIVVGTLVNTAGTVTAPLSASCTATLGNNTVVLTATDGAGASTNGNVVVAVTANTAPTLAYGNQIVAPAGTLTINPSTALSDNGTVASVVVQGQGSYTGTISVNASGVVSVSNAAPAGGHTITIRATDNCGTFTDATFDLLVNTPPTITPGTPSARQGSPAALTTIATVADGESPAGSISVNTPTLSAGLSLVGLANNAGVVQGNLAASCSAAVGAGSITLFAGDGRQGTTASIPVDVLANTPPTFAYAAQAVATGASLTVNPSTALTDNGTIATVLVLSTGTYTGTIAVNASGVVSISNAAPSGTHTITIRATDNCGAQTDTSFTLAVNALPTVTPATGLTRQRGTAASGATLGTVADFETPAANIAVSASPPAGIVVGALVNTAGTITAPLSASCAATLGNNTVVLTATDGAGNVGAGNVIVAVTANTAPTLAYGNQIVAPGAALTVSPSTALGDNGSATVAVQGTGTYTGTISVDASGVVSVSNAAPAGAHIITIRATDNCGTTTDATFELLVNTPPTITPAAPSVLQGSPAAFTTIATVADGESPAGSISINTPTLSPGLVLTGLANNAGTVQANLSASCSSTVGANSISLFAGDGRQGTTVSIPVDVQANTPPALAYTTQSVPTNGTLVVNPTTAPSDNGSIVNVFLVSAGTYTGTISVNASGAVSVSNAAPSGTHTITIRATDNCGTTTDATFTLAVNSLPTVTAATGLTRQRGTPASVATLGSVADLETAAGSIAVSATPPAGIVVGALVNSTGTVTAPLSAACTAVLGNNTVVLTATDGAGSSTNGNVLVAVTDNTAPTLAFGNQIVAPGAALTVNPTTALSDNGSATVAVQGVSGYTGTIAVDPSGVVSVSNAAPAGAHIITIRATDNCGTTTDASFELLVNTPPTITPGTPSVRQGSPASLTTIATVADGESAAGSLSVNTPSVAPGLTLTGLVNNAGTVQANVAAACNATTGANPISLFAGDGRQGTTATVNVDVLANTPPTVTYAAHTLSLGGSALVLPTAAPADNGNVASIVLQSAGTYTGVVSVDTQGRVTFANAAPVGTHTLQVRLTDNCGSTTDQPVSLSVGRSSATLQLSSSVSPSRYGQAVTLTADVSGTAPTGSIEFLADDVSLGSSPLTGSGDNRSATLTVSTLAVGNPQLKARYAGDLQNAPVESLLGTQLVQAAATRVTLAPDANPGAPGNRTIGVQVQANAPGGGTPAGTVNLVSGASNCTATLNAGAGSCALNLATVGYKTITATYTPANGNHTSSNASTSIVIADGSTTGDVRVRIGNGKEFITPGMAVQYQVTIDNVGPNAMIARVQVPMAAQLLNTSFQCLRAGPAQCGTLSGSGNIDTEVQLGPGGLVIYTINATAPTVEAIISQSATATVIAPGTDPVPANNTATDTDPMGLFLNGFEDATPDESADE